MVSDPATQLLCTSPQEISALLYKGLHCIIASNSGEKDTREVSVSVGHLDKPVIQIMKYKASPVK